MSRRPRRVPVALVPVARASPPVMTFLGGNLPGGEYRAIISITKIHRRRDGTEKKSEYVAQRVSDFQVSRGRVLLEGKRK